MLRILLVDDHILFRKGVAALLDARPNMQILGEASNGVEAVNQARELLPDIILMDIGMPELNGLEATKRIKQEMPHVKIIMLTASDEDQNLFTAIKNGAQGYLLKDLEPYQLYDLLENISKGEAPLSGTIAAKILKEFTQPKETSSAAIETMGDLTSREINVLSLIAEGKTNREIAAELVISENTVKIHLRNILDKLHLQNRIQAAVYAVKQGLTDKEI
jgi:DNA-binding NarL/FixJ family response regulator